MSTQPYNMNLPATMKCIVYGLESPLLQIRPTPPSGRKGHVLVRVQAVGLNPVDAKEVMGDKLPSTWTMTRSWLRSHVLSHKIPGFDFSGICMEEEEGNSTTTTTTTLKLARGDKVYGTMPPLQGTLAEYISVPLDQISIMPTNLKFEEAAALPLVGLTALQSLSPHVSSDTTVLVIGGSGGTGHVALQVARCLSSRGVTTICSSANQDFCRSCGAQEVLDYQPGAEAIVTSLMQSPHKPFHVILDCVSSADPRDMSMNYPSLLQHDANSPQFLAENYVYRRLGGPTSDWIRAGLERTTGMPWLWPNRHEKLFWIRFPNSSGELQRITEWVQDGKLRPHIDATYEFTEEGVKKAFDDILTRRVKGKCVVIVGEKET